MDKPTKAVLIPERKLSRLEFARADNPDAGEYYLRGGICWPESGGAPGQAPQGFALMCGLNIRDRVLRVFEQVSFLTVDHVLRPDGGIEREGVSAWFVEVWRRYFARTFYVNTPESVHRVFLLQTIRSPMIEPKPEFPEVFWRESREAWSLVSALIESGRLRVQEGTELDVALTRYCASPDGKLVPPAVWALMCAVFGMERSPWREPRNWRTA
jgi:hypothetical protein